MIVRELVTLLTYRSDRASLQRTDQDFRRVERQAQATATAVGAFVGTITAHVAMLAAQASARLAGLATEAIRSADSITSLANRLNVALEGSGENAADWMERMRRLSTELGASLDTVSSGILRFGPTFRDAGGNLGDAEVFLRMMLQGAQISGANRADTEGLLTQLGQSASAGVLRGEEYARLVEVAPVVQRQLATALSVSVEQLKKMADDGQLTFRRILPAIRSMAPEIQRRFEQMAQTTEFAWSRAMRTWELFSGELVKTLGVDGLLVRGLTRGREAVERLRSRLQDLKAWIDRMGGSEAVFERLRRSAEAAGIAIAALVGPAVLRGVAALLLRLAPLVAFFLVIEDLYAWITGNNSAIGQALGPFNDLAEGGILGSVVSTLQEMGRWLRWVGEYLGGDLGIKVGAALAYLLALRMALGALGVTAGRVGSVLRWAFGIGGGAAAAAAGSAVAAGAATAASSILGRTPGHVNGPRVGPRTPTTPGPVAEAAGGRLAQLFGGIRALPARIIAGTSGFLGPLSLVLGAASLLTSAEDHERRERNRQNYLRPGRGAQYIPGFDEPDEPDASPAPGGGGSFWRSLLGWLGTDTSPGALAGRAIGSSGPANVTITAPITLPAITVTGVDVGTDPAGAGRSIGESIGDGILDRLGRLVGIAAPRTEVPAQ